MRGKVERGPVMCGKLFKILLPLPSNFIPTQTNKENIKEIDMT
jgi:hypothetical protein